MTSTASPTRVLVVEDQAVVALDICGQLEKLGYVVCGVADSGDQALTMAVRERPDVVLMDIRIGGPTDGVTAGEELYVCENIPVVFLSAHSDEQTVMRASKSGAYGYLTKPFALQSLNATLQVAVRKHAEVEQLRQSTSWQYAVLSELSTGVIVMGHDGKLRFMNAAAQELTGWAYLEALTLNPPWLETLREAKVWEQLAATYLVVYKPDGTTVRTRVRRSVAHSPEGDYQIFVLRAPREPVATSPTPPARA